MEVDPMLDESRNVSLPRDWSNADWKDLEAAGEYQKVAVLIIRWDGSLDYDLKVKEEAEELEDVFRNGFHFETRIVPLDVNERPQVVLDSAVAAFVDEHHGIPQNHLLIVYYTGHGFVRTIPAPEYLCISGRSGPQDLRKSSYPPEARWDQTELILSDAEGDVLTILDCCFAGTTMEYPIEHLTKSHEILVACGKDDITQGPGNLSYTRALIDSLKEVLQSERKKISTFDLHQKILGKRSWNATSRFCNRSQTSARHIVLAPLPRNSELKVEAPL